MIGNLLLLTSVKSKVICFGKVTRWLLCIEGHLNQIYMTLDSMCKRGERFCRIVFDKGKFYVLFVIWIYGLHFWIKKLHDDFVDRSK